MVIFDSAALIRRAWRGQLRRGHGGPHSGRGKASGERKAGMAGAEHESVVRVHRGSSCAPGSPKSKIGGFDSGAAIPSPGRVLCRGIDRT